MKPILSLLVLALALSGCANARNTGSTKKNVRQDSGVKDKKVTPPPKKDRGGVKPKQDKGRKDGPVSDVKPWPKDLPPPPPDQGKPDLPTPKPCPDPLEPNNTCLAGRSIGSTTEGTAWVKKSATLSPPGDVDWFYAAGKEASHSCLPFTSQTYYFRFRVDVPAGRQVKACVIKDSCSGSNICKTASGPSQINVQYKVSGTCAFTDDTKAKMMVQALDTKHSCAPYSMSFNYK